MIKNKWVLVLNISAVIFYFIIISKLGGREFIKNSLFNTVDSNDYLLYSKWITGEGDYCSPYRTFFYPLIMMMSMKTAGLVGLWAMQFFFWLAACNLIFFTIFNITKNIIPSVIAYTLVVLNISLIVYTANGLTEITVFFLLSLFLFILLKVLRKPNNINMIFALLFVLSLLVVTKPVYQIVWYITVLMILFFIRKDILKKPVIILLIILACSPILIQKIIIKKTYNTFSTTKIADYNLRNYFFRKVKYYDENHTLKNFDLLPDSVHTRTTAEAQHYTKSGIINFIIYHPFSSMSAFWDNIKDNHRMGNPLINKRNNPKLYKWTQNINDKFFYIHLLALIVWSTFLIIKIKQRNNLHYQFVFFCGLLSFYTLYYVGITFWAGDRLIAPAIAAWSVLYIILFLNVFKLIKPGKNIL
ncbi:MAG TPA: hypothetical protein PKK00_12205 [Bacteroidales bacterium]|nr:hypothetical protein [Bacteroidales bacterium]HPS17813.1 hypothetical protein [Bacteroidales bacterium]